MGADKQLTTEELLTELDKATADLKETQASWKASVESLISSLDDYIDTVKRKVKGKGYE